MAEEKINRVTVEDLPRPEKELTPEEAKQVQGGVASKEQQNKAGSDAFSRAEQDIKAA